MLLDRGVDVNSTGGADVNYTTNLDVTSRRFCCFRGHYYGNALQAAARGGSLEVVELLLARGVDPRAFGGIHRTAYDAAMLGGYDVIARRILECIEGSH